jgi:hypothetical protein
VSNQTVRSSICKYAMNGTTRILRTQSLDPQLGVEGQETGPQRAAAAIYPKPLPVDSLDLAAEVHLLRVSFLSL